MRKWNTLTVYLHFVNYGNIDSLEQVYEGRWHYHYSGFSFLKWSNARYSYFLNSDYSSVDVFMNGNSTQLLYGSILEFSHYAWFSLCYDRDLKDNCRIGGLSIFFLIIDQFWVMIPFLMAKHKTLFLLLQRYCSFTIETIIISLKCTDVYLNCFHWNQVYWNHYAVCLKFSLEHWILLLFEIQILITEI